MRLAGWIVTASIAGFILTVIWVVASSEASKAESRQQQQARVYTDDISILTDHETGCQYVRPRYAGNAAFVPRISPDGKSIMGCKEGKQ